MKKGDLSIETLFWIVMFVIALGIVFFIFVQARSESLNLLDLIPV